MFRSKTSRKNVTTQHAIQRAVAEAIESRLYLSTTYYVGTSNAGDDASHGTSASTPFATIQYALSTTRTSPLASGDTVLIEGGTYTLGTGGNNSAGILLPALSNITIKNYNTTPVYITGAKGITSTWTSQGGGTYSTAFSGSVQQAFVNFNPANGTSQTPLIQVGSSGGSNDNERHQIAWTGTLAAGQFYDDGTTLYVHLSSGAAPTSGQVSVNNPNVSELMYYPSGSSANGYLIQGLNFSVDSATGASAGVSTMGGAVRVPTSSVLKDCNIYYADFDGVELGSSSASMIGCNVYYAGCTGVQSDQSTNLLIENCDVEFSNYRHFDASWGAGGIKIIPNSSGTVTENQIANNEGTGLWADTDLSGSTLVFSDNFVHGNIAKAVDYLNVLQGGIWGEAGIKVEVSENVQVYNNIVTGNGGNGILVAGAQNTIVQNNTVTNNFGQAAIGLTTDGERTVHSLYMTETNNVVYNNIIAHNSTTYDLLMATNPPRTELDPGGLPWISNNLSDYNIFYRVGEPLQISDGNPTDDGHSTAGTTMQPIETTLAAWRTETGQDMHSLNTDPEFAASSGSWGYNQSTDTYTPGNYDPLGTGSPAVNASKADLSFGNDYELSSRTVPYDIGAREYTSAAVATFYTVPTTDQSAWVDDTLPQAAVEYETVHSLNGVTARVEPPNWINSTSTAQPWNWLSGTVSASGASAIEQTDTGITEPDVMQFNNATQTMVVGSGDTVYLYVNLAPNGTGTFPSTNTTTPTAFAISFQTSSGWTTLYWAPSSTGTDKTNLTSMYSNTPQYQGTVSAALVGTWTKIALSANTIGLSGKTVTGLSLYTDGGEMAWDDIGDAPATPPAPTNLTATSPAGSTQVDLSWKFHAPNDGTGIEIQRSTDGINFSNYASVPINTNTYSDTVLGGNTTLYYRVYVIGNVNNSAFSNQVAGVTGMVGSWQMEDGSGTKVSDSSGFGNNGTINGTGVTWGSGKVGGGLAFNGSSGSYVSAPDSNSLDTSSAMAISAWVDQSTTTTGYTSGSGIDKNGSYGLIATTIGSTTKWEFYITDSTGVKHTAIATTGATNGAWHYLVGNWGGAQIKLWVDGVNVATTSWSGTIMNSTSTLDIGRGGGSVAFNGSIDEVAVLNRVMSTGEIAQNYSLGNSGIHSNVKTGGGKTVAATMPPIPANNTSTLAASSLSLSSSLDPISGVSSTKKKLNLN